MGKGTKVQIETKVNSRTDFYFTVLTSDFSVYDIGNEEVEIK